MHVIKLAINKILHILYWIGLLGAAIIAIILIALYVIDPYWLAADSCVDMGNVWNHEEKRCIGE